MAIEMGCVPFEAKTTKDALSKKQNFKFQTECDISSEQVPVNQLYKDSPRMKKEINTFDVLALPFAEHLRYQRIRAMSIENENICKFWKQYLYGLPDSGNKGIPNINNKFWRWKNYLKYVPNENSTNTKKKMSSGPKLDKVGRLPIPADELSTYREYNNNALMLNLKNKIVYKKGHRQIVTKS